MASSTLNLAWKEGLKPRKPTALLRGKEYKIDKFIRDLSLYKDKDGNSVYKLIAVYNDFKMKFYTYLPKQYDNKDDAYVDRLNTEIQDGKNIRIIFYGCIGSSNELYIHEHNEPLDEEKLEGIRLIEESERGGKRSGSDVGIGDEDDSGTKKSKSE